MATSLPATLFFLSGLDVYANETLEKLNVKSRPDFIGPALTASTSAYTTAEGDGEAFVTTWFTSFTSLV